MGKNDFDLDFDFEEEYGFDPKSFLGSEEYDENIDLSEFSDEELGLSAPPQTADDEEEFQEESDNGFDLDEELTLDDFLNMSTQEEEDQEDAFDPESAFPEMEEETVDAEDEETEEDDYPDVMVFPKRQTEEPSLDDTMIYSQESMLVEEAPQEEAFQEEGFDQAPDYDEEEEDSEEEEPAARPRREFNLPKITIPKINMPKITTPRIFTKFYDLYFAPVLNKDMLEEPRDPNNPRRRRRKSKMQIFKEVYLPPIIACVCLILVLSFTIGSISNAIAERRLHNQVEKDKAQQESQAADLVQEEYETVMEEAAALAAGYNYSEAIRTLESFSGYNDTANYPDVAAKRAELVTMQTQLIEHRDPSIIPNLSFHVLIEDLSRALVDEELGGSYNRNFVSTQEFTKILNDLYNNGYVLVDFDSFIANSGTNGSDAFFTKPIYLPAGKQPIMITETMANYYAYMIDGDGDKEPDAKGDGFASKLVVQGGKIKAEYTDASGNKLVGDYDLVPILESFIEAHPDFSYQGARATVAVTGYEGIFGYRTNTSYIASKGQAYYDEQVAGAKEVVQALRDKGYRLACFTYGNKEYGGMSAAQITADLQEWTKNITPVIGNLDTFIFARTSNITDYNGSSFDVLYNTGFRYFVAHGTSPWAEVNNSYVRQNRLMVTGNSMAWNPSWFTGMFDCAAILDVNARGDVPN